MQVFQIWSVSVSERLSVKVLVRGSGLRWDVVLEQECCWVDMTQLPEPTLGERKSPPVLLGLSLLPPLMALMIFPCHITVKAAMG
jgi:hypothetical protein